MRYLMFAVPFNVCPFLNSLALRLARASASHSLLITHATGHVVMTSRAPGAGRGPRKKGRKDARGGVIDRPPESSTEFKLRLEAGGQATVNVPLIWPVCQRVQRVVKTVKVWTASSIACLQGCFDCTDWEVFYDACRTLDELVDTVTAYIRFCVDSGTAEEKRQVNKEVKAAIRLAQRTYKNKVETKFAGGNFRAAWQGIKNMAAVNVVSDA
ncbi:hypothetical protein BaRGS_00003315, partial [Batillaria attramentaria]